MRTQAGDRRAVAVARHRHAHGQPSAARSQVALPPAPHDGGAARLQEAVAGTRRGGRRDIDPRGRDFGSTVDHVIEDGAVAATHVDRLEDGNIHCIFDHPALVARRERDVLDDGIERMTRIDLAVGDAVELLVWSGSAEARAAQRRRRGVLNDDPGDARL